MKRNLLVLGCMVMILSSCGKDPLEVGYPDMNAPITFKTYSHKATKADTHDQLEYFYKTFKVYGWKSPTGAADSWTTVFNNVTVEYFGNNVTKHGDQLGYADEGVKFIYPSSESYTPADEWKDFIYAPNTSTTGWYYEGIRYFDKYMPYYRFMAYAPSRAGNVITIDKNNEVFKIGDATNKITVEDTNLRATPDTVLTYRGFQYDYMTASNDSKDHGVGLIFSHELAKLNVRIQVQSSFVESLNQYKSKLTTILPVVVNEVSIHKLNGTSYYDSSMENEAGYLSGWKQPAEGEIEYKVTNIPLTGTDHDDDFVKGFWVLERLLMPQTVAKCALATQMTPYDNAYMYVKYSVGDEAFQCYVALCNLFTTENTLDLKGGNEYSITVLVGPDPVYFQVSVDKIGDNDKTFNF